MTLVIKAVSPTFKLLLFVKIVLSDLYHHVHDDRIKPEDTKF